MKTVMRIFALTLVLVGINFMVNANNDYTYTQAGDSIVINFGEGGRMVVYLKNSDDLDELKAIDLNEIVLKMSTYIDSARTTESGTIIVKNEMGEFKITVEEVEEDDDEGDFHISIGGGDGIVIRKNGERVKVNKNSRTESYVDFYVGLNGYLEDGSMPDGTNYDLRPLGSRYFELNFRTETRIGGVKSPLYIDYALGFSWYNFMFDGNNQVEKVNNQIVFTENTNFNLDKSKLTASYFTVPVMLKLKGKRFRLAAGGYAAYRLGSHSKIKYLNDENDTVKDKDFGNFNMTNFRYGAQVELGLWDVTLFGKYDFNELFTNNSGAPKLNAFAFGIKI